MTADTSGLTSGTDAFFSDIKQRAIETMKRSVDECGPTIEQRGREIFKEVVDDFYGSYTPIYYNRNKSMGNILDISYNSQNIHTEFDDSRFSSTNGTLNGEGLYEIVFKRGYHGGAPSGPGHPSPGTPYWRSPHPFYWYWSQPAHKSDPPYDVFDRRYDEYLDSDEVRQLIQDTFEKNFDF